jgi:arginine deiminase
MIAPLRKVLVKRPGPAFATADPDRWHYVARPNLAAARQEHDALADLLCQAGAEVFYHDESQPGRADAIYV